ncbi:hypothetical protein HAV22_02615 [Massilia sp. TW-1]|uniref:Uncharacterized protein n=1 Tax=Telluria antibiotica TaxID=2717319 RepID=A0ABX0P779_9BURK|nr:hypothetical protein [Telluria antibiotica]NIA52548.1 hypothetical protein [Telluria antibiotica]
MLHRVAFIILSSVVVPYVQAQPFYPVVAKAEQKSRDEDRRLILQTELATEREALSKVNARLGEGTSKEDRDAVHRHEENIKALQRELEGDAQSGGEAPRRLSVRALHPAASTGARAPRFWDPYNRAIDLTDSSTSQRSESHE